MKHLILAIALLGSVNAFAFSKDRGGGDICEDRIKVIRDDIQSWISGGGSAALKLPAGIDLQSYDQQMLMQIAAAKIRCVGDGDNGYPVEINGTPKICRFDKKSNSSRITCDFTKFQSIAESDQYILIHHEYAGLAGVETPNADDSNYDVSNQISENLADQVVKKLVVKAPAVYPDPSFPGWIPLDGALGAQATRLLSEAVVNTKFRDCKLENYATPGPNAMPQTCGGVSYYQFSYGYGGPSPYLVTAPAYSSGYDMELGLMTCGWTASNGVKNFKFFQNENDPTIYRNFTNGPGSVDASGKASWTTQNFVYNLNAAGTKILKYTYTLTETIQVPTNFGTAVNPIWKNVPETTTTSNVCHANP